MQLGLCNPKLRAIFFFPVQKVQLSPRQVARQFHKARNINLQSYFYLPARDRSFHLFGTLPPKSNSLSNCIACLLISPSKLTLINRHSYPCFWLMTSFCQIQAIALAKSQRLKVPLKNRLRIRNFQKNQSFSNAIRRRHASIWKSRKEKTLK